MKQMLEPDPEKRLSAVQCLKHEFFRESAQDGYEHNALEDLNEMEQSKFDKSNINGLNDKYSLVHP
jgi:serine/threonine protein kinase